MAAKFFALLTNQGAAKLSNMAALGEKLEITSLAVGDGGGVSPTPHQAQTKLVNEVRRAQLNSLSVDEKNDSQIIAEQIIPESVGGWWIREIGLYDADDVLIAVANCPETYKATTAEGSGRTQVIRMMLTVSSTDVVTLKVDPSIVLATRQYVDSAVIEVKTYTDNAMKKHVDAANPHSQYPLIENALKELADAGLVGEVLENFGLVDSSGAVGRLVNVKKITASGTYTPTAGAKFCIAELQAGGGGGGSAATCTNGQSAGGGGGASGGYALIKFTAATSAVVIGSGGSGGVASASGTNGVNGGNTSIAGVTVYGGSGGWSGPARSTFPQGNNTSGRTTASSNNGSAIVVKDLSGQSGQGGVAYGPANSFGGGGGSSPLGVGAGGGITTSSSGVGAAGNLYGSGGSGSASVSGTPSVIGGDGSSGVVIIWEYS